MTTRVIVGGYFTHLQNLLAAFSERWINDLPYRFAEKERFFK